MKVSARVENTAPIVRSERKPLYKQYALQLVESGNAYYSFDTAEELNAQRAACEAKGETFNVQRHQPERHEELANHER